MKQSDAVVRQTMGSNTWIANRGMNNNAESINNLLKVSADWKQLPTAHVIDNVYDVVRVQYSDARRTLYGQGNFLLAPPFSRHSVTYNVWQAADERRREHLFNKFLNDNSQRELPTVVTSADGAMTIPATSRVARKPGQRTRPKAGTRTRKNSKK